MMQTAVKTKKPRKQAVSGRFWAERTYRGRIKDDHKIDPAVGSGAFPLGMLNEIVRARQNITTYMDITQKIRDPICQPIPKALSCLFYLLLTRKYVSTLFGFLPRPDLEILL